MKIILRLTLLLSMATLGYSQMGGGYDLSWSSVDGGGTVSTGGRYRLTGVAGQPDAGVPMTGGAYAVQGGFLAAEDLQRSAVPTWTQYSLEPVGAMER